MVVMMSLMVLVMMVRGGKRRACACSEEQGDQEKLLHGLNVARKVDRSGGKCANPDQRRNGRHEHASICDPA